MRGPRDFICHYRGPAEGDLEVWPQLIPDGYSGRSVLGPHQTEITPSPWSAAHEDIVTVEQQEVVKQTIDKSVEATSLYETYLPQRRFISLHWSRPGTDSSCFHDPQNHSKPK